MMRARKRTFGETLYKGYGSDLDGLLRLHSVLIQRGMQDQWRFGGGRLVTGPYETLMGYHNCGTSGGGFEYHYADIAFRDGIKQCCERIRSLCLSAMCLFRGFASLDEELPSRSFDHCQSEFNSVAKFERSRTMRSRYPKWNQRHGLSTFLTSCSQILESHCEVRS